jgi:hypothetical protein
MEMGEGTLAGPDDVPAREDTLDTMIGVPALTVIGDVRNRDGVRDYKITVERDGKSIDVLMLFATGGETFDPGEAVTFARHDTPNHEEPLRPGDELVMRFSLVK